ncbi:hypothetical protein BGX31_009922 [Mortierella sp. GBA43]|nr:hypothetical protein BGX31_009922 [Mortierella sp. GBA43]
MTDLTHPGDTTRTASTRLSAVTVHELLQSIFTHLSPYILRSVARLVCRQWYQVAQLILETRPVIWIESLTRLDEARQKVNQQRLGFTHTLDIRIDTSIARQSDPRPSIWQALVGPLETLAQEQQLKIKHLSVNRNMGYVSHLFPLLTLVAPNLTELKINDMCNGETVPLDKILVLCPHLVALHVDYSSYACYNDIHERGIKPELELPSRLKLRSLTLVGIGFESKALLRLLGSCHYLEALCLMNMQQLWMSRDRMADFTRQAFMDQFTWYCRKVRRLHLSVSGWSLWPTENFKSTIRLLKQYPHVREWSFAFEDAVPRLIRAFKKPYLDRLTSLELVDTKITHESIKSSQVVGYRLFKFMCQSPHLLHLKAPMVDFSIRWMDLEGILTPFGYTRARYLRSLEDGLFSSPYSSASTPAAAHRTIWACRRLRTLHFGCYMGNDHTAENARVLFGYLSRVCPELQDLEIHRKCLTMQLEGGFCLLTRLHDLRRLKIITWSEKQEGQIAPIAPPPPQSSSLLLSSSSSLMSSVSEPVSVAPSSSSPSPPRYVDWVQKSITPELRTQLSLQLDLEGSGSSGDSNSKEGGTGGIKRSMVLDHNWNRRRVPARRPFKSSEPRRVGGDRSMALRLEEEDEGEEDPLFQDVKTREMTEEWDDLDFMIDGVDMRNLGQWKDITDLFQDRLLTNWSCWPQLEYLAIQSTPPSHSPLSINPLNEMKARIRELRPEIEVA